MLSLVGVVTAVTWAIVGSVLSITNEIIKYGKVSRAWIGEFRFRRGFYTDSETNTYAITAGTIAFFIGELNVS